MGCRPRPTRLLIGTVAGLLLVVLSVLAPDAVADEPTQQIFSYVGSNGRTVYVNGIERVPSERREQAQAVDLSHVSLNEELGTEMRHAIDAQLEELLDSDYCVGLRSRAGRGLWQTAWHEHGHLLLIGVALLLFALASPYLVRTIGVPRWTKLALMLVPTLALLGLLATAGVKASQGMRELRAAAEPCQPSRYREEVSTPAAQSRRLHNIFDLRQKIEAAASARTQLVERAVRE